MRDKAFDLIRHRKLIETASEHFLQVLNAGTISTNMFLRRLHNFAVGMHWLPWPVLPKLHWPAVKHKDRRAITADEHQRIIDREHNPEIRAYYQLLWHLGGSQTDIAELTAEDIDWKDRTISYQRRKTSVPVIITFGTDAASAIGIASEVWPVVPAHGADQGKPPRQDVHQTAQDSGDHRHFLAQLPLRLGGTGQDSGNAGTVRPAGPWAQFQGHCPSILQKGQGYRAVAGGIRAENRADAAGRKPVGTNVKFRNRSRP